MKNTKVLFVLLALFVFALASCTTNPVTGSKELDTAKIDQYIKYMQMFNSGLLIAANTVAAVDTDPDVQARVLQAKVDILAAQIALAQLDTLVRSGATEEAIEQAQSEAQAAAERANEQVATATSTGVEQ